MYAQKKSDWIILITFLSTLYALFNYIFFFFENNVVQRSFMYRMQADKLFQFCILKKMVVANCDNKTFVFLYLEVVT